LTSFPPFKHANEKTGRGEKKEKRKERLLSFDVLLQGWEGGEETLSLSTAYDVATNEER